MSNTHHLVQINVAQMKYDMMSAEMSGFTHNLVRINKLAEESPGFIWRLKDEDADAANAEQLFGNDKIVNMSVWENVEALRQFVFYTDHINIMNQRKQWFHKIPEAYAALWWIDAGTIPTLQQAKQKLTLLEESGPIAEAFTFKRLFGV